MFEETERENYFERIGTSVGVLRNHYLAPRIVGLVLVAGVISFFIPFNTTVVPEWKVQVVDSAGKPVQGAWVRQSWKHYSLDLSAGTNFDEFWSDRTGRVTFLRKTVRKSLAQRMVLTALAKILTLAHGSTGIRASVWAVTNECSSDFLEYDASRLLPETLMLRCLDS